MNLKNIYNNTLDKFLDYKSNLNLEELIKDSVKIRLRSDVKTAVLLSGGIDSAVVAQYAKKLSKDLIFIKGYMGNDEDHQYAKELAKNLKIKLLEVPLDLGSNKNILKRINKIIKYMEAPIPITGLSVSTNIMYEKISKLGIKVVIDGNGGDEIYSGYYDRYSRYFINSCIDQGEIIKLIKFIYHTKKNKNFSLKSMLKNIIQKIGNKYLNFKYENKIFNYLNLSNRNLNPYIKSKVFDNLINFQIWDNQFSNTQMMLKLWDNSVMMNSVESRSPLFDYRQIPYIKSKIDEKFVNGFNKPLLREVLSDQVCSKVKNRKTKQPLRWSYENDLLQHSLDEIKSSILKSKIVNTIVSEREIHKLFKNLKLINNKQKILRLFSVSVFENFYGSNIE